MAIAAIRERAIRALDGHWYTDAERDAWVGQLVPEAYASRLGAPGVMVALEGGRPAGFVQVDLDRAEVVAIYVDPDLGRRGHGRALLARAEEFARAAGLAALRLNASLNAVPFYERCGWRTDGVTLHRLRDGTELAVFRMERDLGGPPEGAAG